MTSVKHMVVMAVTVACGVTLAAAPQAQQKAPAGFTSVFNGKDLSGWQHLHPRNLRGRGQEDSLPASSEIDRAVFPLFVLRACETASAARMAFDKSVSRARRVWSGDRVPEPANRPGADTLLLLRMHAVLREG